jgi:hypothetical protein
MPVHKILAFLMDLKIIITFIKDLIRLVLDIIAQIVIIIKLIFGGLQSLADLMKTLKDLIGVDKILNMVDYITELFKPKLVEAKILLENSISPIYYNETEDYERRVSDIEKELDSDLKDKANIKSFVSLRKNNPPIDILELRKITEIFSNPYIEYKLDSTYEPNKCEVENKEVNTDHEMIFALLQKYVKLNLVVPVDAEHMYYAAINNKSCKLTAQGQHYWKLVSKRLI